MRIRTERQRRTEELHASIIWWYQQHLYMSYKDIGKQFHRCESTISKVLKAAGYPSRGQPIGRYKRILLEAREHPRTLIEFTDMNEDYKRQVEYFRTQADELEGRKKWLIKHQNNRIWVAYF